MDPKPGRIPLDVSTPHQAKPAAPQPPAVPKPSAADAGPVDVGEIKDKIVEAVRTCFDPEIPVNIYELGLIYDVDVAESGDVKIKMTLTSPACPAAGSLPPDVQDKVSAIPGVKSCKVEIVWDPPWTPERMSDAAKVQLGMF